jgi:lysozyme
MENKRHTAQNSRNFTWRASSDPASGTQNGQAVSQQNGEGTPAKPTRKAHANSARNAASRRATEGSARRTRRSAMRGSATQTARSTSENASTGKQTAATVPAQTTVSKARPTRRASAASTGSGIPLTAKQFDKRPLYVIIAIVLLAALGIGACNAMSNWLNTPAKKNTRSTTSDAYESPYDFAGFAYDANGRLTYSENGILMSKAGIDISEYQGDIDWPAVAGDGISFAFVRVGSRGNTDGYLYVDSCFDQNIDGAAAAGLQVGTYFYSQAITVEEAQAEADLVISELAGRKLDLPVVFDYELDFGSSTRGGSIDRETLTQIALAFCKRIEAAGYKTMIYGNSSDVSRFNLSELGNRTIWYAEYDDIVPNAQFDFAIWQYTSSGVVAGIDAAVDMDMLVAGMM